MEQIRLNYYSHIVTNRAKDLTAEELDKIKQSKETNQAMTIVGLFFGAIITLAFLAEHGNTYI